MTVTVAVLLEDVMMTTDGKEKQDDDVVSKDRVDEGASEAVRVTMKEVPTTMEPVGIPVTFIVFGTYNKLIEAGAYSLVEEVTVKISR